MAGRRVHWAAMLATCLQNTVSVRRLLICLLGCLTFFLVRKIDLNGNDSDGSSSALGSNYLPYYMPNSADKMLGRPKYAAGRVMFHEQHLMGAESYDGDDEVEVAPKVRRDGSAFQRKIKAALAKKFHITTTKRDKPSLDMSWEAAAAAAGGKSAEVNRVALSASRHKPDHPERILISVGSSYSTTSPQPIVERIDGNYSRPPYLFVSAYGRFGNHLFQYASMLGLAREQGRQPALTKELRDLGAVFQNITAPMVTWNRDEVRLLRAREHVAGVFTLSLLAIPWQDAEVCCFLQSWKYFAAHERELRQQLVFREPMRSRAQRVVDGHVQRYVDNVNALSDAEAIAPGDVTVVGLHVRRDDVAEKEQMARGYKPATVAYIHQAMRHYKQSHRNVLFLACSDDMAWCRQNLPGFSVALVDPATDDDLAILSHCNHTIITVGTFGWWAGWLAGGQVVYYKDWPTPRTEIGMNYMAEDYFPKDWIPL